VSSRLASRALLALIFSTIICAETSITCAQDIETGTTRRDLTGGASAARSPRNSPPRQIYVTRTRTVTVTKKVVFTPTTGTLSVSSNVPNASLLIEPKRGGSEGQRGTIPPGELGFIFNDLKPGVYRVAASLDGYEPAEKDVTITRNKAISITLTLEPITYNVTVNANVKTGEIRYAPVEVLKDTRTGETRYSPKGVTSVIPIQDGRVVLTNLPAGTYGVDIRPGEVGYQKLLGAITVPGKDTITVNLERLLSTKTFFAAWTRDEWDLPPGWRIASSLLSVSGRGVALPRNESYRYYTDFQLSSDVRMNNGVAVSFALRASDTQNYYLVQLTGAKADEPYFLRAFVVKNGAAQLLQSIPISHLASTIKQGQFFKVHIKMKANSMNIFVDDSQSGASLPLGILTDSYQNFSIGAIGIAAGEKEQSDYGSFMVCTPECPKS
jgi:PEGA domain